MGMDPLPLMMVMNNTNRTMIKAGDKAKTERKEKKGETRLKKRQMK